MNSLLKHPIFLAGFRPFFVIAIIYGCLLPMMWILVYSGKLEPFGFTNALLWHSHEMIFGFGWAVLGGFLLTASKNWVKIRGIHGGPLLYMVCAWAVERVAIYSPNVFGGAYSPLWYLSTNLFLLSIIGYLLFTLITNRKNDTFPDNFLFYFLLVLFFISKILILTPEYFRTGFEMSIGLFRLAFAVMFERTITQFMKSTEGVELKRIKPLDYAIKLSVLALAFSGWLPDLIAGYLFAFAGTLLLVRWIMWHPLIGFRRFGNATMYIGYFGLTLHLLLVALTKLNINFQQIGALNLHVFTFLCMGVVIPSMLIRICQGHTGRKPEFKSGDRVAISLMLLASVFRLVLTQTFPDKYTLWIGAASVLWSSCFLIIGLRLIPYCFQPRIDGKEH